MTENGLKIRLKGVEHTAGWMVGCTKASGLTTIWMEWVSTPGLMAVPTWENIWMIRNMVMVYINGQMVDFI